MSRNTKEKSAARELQATLGCSYSTALKKVRDAEALRKAQESLAKEHMTPIEVVQESSWVSPEVANVRARRFPTKDGEK